MIQGLKRVRVIGTHRCNMGCSFCYEGRDCGSDRELSTTELKIVIDKIAEEGVPIIRLTGGEFLLRRDANHILEYCRARHLKVGLNTNGLRINKENVDILEENVHQVILSFPGYDPESTTRATGLKNAFEKKVHVMELLRNRHIHKTLSTVATKENIANTHKFFSMFREYEFNDWCLLREIPASHAVIHASAEDYERLVDDLIGLNAQNGTNFFISNSLPFCVASTEKVLRVVPPVNNGGPYCELTVDTDGTVIPLPNVRQSMGNLLDDTLSSCWNSGLALKWRRFELLPDCCRACTLVLRCKGGHRSAAFHTRGSLYALDPLARPHNVISPSA